MLKRIKKVETFVETQGESSDIKRGRLSKCTRTETTGAIVWKDGADTSTFQKSTGEWFLLVDGRSLVSGIPDLEKIYKEAEQVLDFKKNSKFHFRTETTQTAGNRNPVSKLGIDFHALPEDLFQETPFENGFKDSSGLLYRTPWGVYVLSTNDVNHYLTVSDVKEILKNHKHEYTK